MTEVYLNCCRRIRHYRATFSFGVILVLLRCLAFNTAVALSTERTIVNNFYKEASQPLKNQQTHIDCPYQHTEAGFEELSSSPAFEIKITLTEDRKCGTCTAIRTHFFLLRGCLFMQGSERPPITVTRTMICPFPGLSLLLLRNLCPCPVALRMF